MINDPVMLSARWCPPSTPVNQKTRQSKSLNWQQAETCLCWQPMLPGWTVPLLTLNHVFICKFLYPLLQMDSHLGKYRKRYNPLPAPTHFSHHFTRFLRFLLRSYDCIISLNLRVGLLASIILWSQLDGFNISGIQESKIIWVNFMKTKTAGIPEKIALR